MDASGRKCLRLALFSLSLRGCCYRIGSTPPPAGDRNRVTPEQSRNLKVGQRVSWLQDDQDRGLIVDRDWSGVKIKWDNGKTSFYHHNDMRDVAAAPLKA